MVSNSGSHRVQKMASLIRSELARLMVSEVSDPRLRHVVITDVEVSRDLRYAKVFFEGGGLVEPKEINKGLARAVPFFRRKLGSNLDIKHVPEIVFEADKKALNVSRVLSLLDEVQKTEGSGPNE